MKVIKTSIYRLATPKGFLMLIAFVQVLAGSLDFQLPNEKIHTIASALSALLLYVGIFHTNPSDLHDPDESKNS